MNDREPLMSLSKGKTSDNSDISDVARGGVSLGTMLFVFSLIILMFILVSGYANVHSWTQGKEGLDQIIFGVVGAGSEVLGAILLVFAVFLWSIRKLSFVVCSLPFLILWAGCVTVNANASYNYFVVSDGAIDKARELSKAKADNSKLEKARTAKLEIKQDRIKEIQSDLVTLPATRTPQEIEGELEKLPNNYKTKRGQLTAELEGAKHRQKLVVEITELRDEVETILDQAVSKIKGSDTNVSPGSVDSGFEQLKWTLVVAIMEFVKAFGFALIFFVKLGQNYKAEKLAIELSKKAKPKRQSGSRASTSNRKPKTNNEPSVTAIEASTPVLNVVRTQETVEVESDEAGHTIIGGDGKARKVRSLA